METIFIGKNCIEVEKTDSTNSYLARLLGEKTVFEGTVVLTHNQAQGRGQRGSTWESEPNKNLMLSILLTPTFLRPEEQFQLNKAISLGVAEFVAGLLSPFEGGKGDVKIKWPNDIYIENKKVAGILIENSVSGSSLQQSIIGIGINVNQEKFSDKVPNPTSLKISIEKELNLKECLAQLCSCIESRYLELRNPHPNLLPKGEGTIDSDYLNNLYRFGEWADYDFQGEILKAKIIGITKLGKLILETEKEIFLECDIKEVGFCN